MRYLSSWVFVSIPGFPITDIPLRPRQPEATDFGSGHPYELVTPHWDTLSPKETQIVSVLFGTEELHHMFATGGRSSLILVHFSCNSLLLANECLITPMRRDHNRLHTLKQTGSACISQVSLTVVH